jgi:hypothetical protein
MIIFFDFRYPCPEVNIYRIAYNALGLSTLVVGECLKGTLPLARDCSAIEVTKTNVALARRLYPAGASIRS